MQLEGENKKKTFGETSPSMTAKWGDQAKYPRRSEITPKFYGKNMYFF